MTFQRDPLSIRYDGAAADLISRAIANAGKTVTGIIESGPRDPVDEGGLSRTERAFQRALYHDGRIHKPRKNSGGPWSLVVEWSPRAGRVRLVRIVVHSDTSGKLHQVARIPAGEQWTRNADLQSGGIGSPKQRFA